MPGIDPGARADALLRAKLGAHPNATNLRAGGKRTHFCGARRLKELSKRPAQFTDRELSEIVRQRIELGARLRVKRLGPFAISALEVEDCYRGLNQSLDRGLIVALGSIPHGFPRFVALEEPTGVEEIDPFLEVVTLLFRHREDDRTFA